MHPGHGGPVRGGLELRGERARRLLRCPPRRAPTSARWPRPRRHAGPATPAWAAPARRRADWAIAARSRTSASRAAAARSTRTTPSIARCRRAATARRAATGCTATTCASVGGNPAACRPLDAGVEPLCFPFVGVAVCQACSASAPCTTGTPCVGGLCRASCDPASPGTCAACLTQGASGICACNASEISGPGGPCSASATTLAICQAGLKCLSGLCRTPCSGSCAAGFTCSDLAGQTVCLPSVDAGPVGGGGGGSGGGGGTTGGGGGTELCGPANCGGCCSAGQCVQPSDQACGTFGGQCNVCQASEQCKLGACARKPGCGCTGVDGFSAMLLALALLGRRRSKAPR